MMEHVVSAAVLAALLLGGCATGPTNPSFALTVEQAEADLDAMARQPRPLARPVVVLDGFSDPGLLADATARRLRELTGDQRIISVNFAFCGSFDSCRQRVVDRVQREFPSTDPNQTIEVDVVAISMGGLVGRHAAVPLDPPPATPPGAAPGPEHRRLRIARLFTLASPHRGAEMAALPTFDRLQIDMRPGSDFLAQCDRDLARADYELVCYTRLQDSVVGTANTAPPGWTPWWLPNRPLTLSHIGLCGDPRVLADILRRLRGETPYTTGTPAPLP